MKRFAFVVMLALSACALAQAELAGGDKCYGKDCVVNTLTLKGNVVRTDTSGDLGASALFATTGIGRAYLGNILISFLNGGENIYKAETCAFSGCRAHRFASIGALSNDGSTPVAQWFRDDQTTLVNELFADGTVKFYNHVYPSASGSFTLGKSGSEWSAAYVQQLIQSTGNITSIAGTGTTTNIPGVVSNGTQHTSVGNLGAGEDDLHTYSLAGSTLISAGRSIRYEASGQIANNANAKTLKLYFGASAILTATLPTSVAANWIATMTVTRMGAGSTQRYVVEVRVINSSTNAVANVFVAQGTLALTETNAQTIKATATATTDNDITQLTSIISYL